MAYRVLILDDDADFNSLLTDIFEQADYDVTSLEDPIEAVTVFGNTDYDLVVTDHRMPEMTGSEFVKTIKQLKSDMPVIMVSGYLENDTIRELITEGVGGVFLKPLNIFSLLERTSELIQESKKTEQASESSVAEVKPGQEANTEKQGFRFRSFPCKSTASLQFSERLYGLRNFKSTLSLIGERGTRYREICEDIRGFYESATEHFLYQRPGSFEGEHVLSMIEQAKQEGALRVTCVLLELESMSEAQKKQAIALSRNEGIFESVGIDLRVIFCVSGDLDTLFDEGLIDDNLYILMGTAEVQIPALRNCPEDVGVLAQQLVAEIAHEQGLNHVPRFEKAASDLLQKQPWYGNFEDLSATVHQMIEAHTGEVLTHAEVSAALKSSVAASPRTRFETYLSGQQLDYVRAVSILLKGDANKTANFFGTEVNAIKSALKY